MGGIYGERLQDVRGVTPEWEKHWKKGEWNTIRARIEGSAPHIQVWMNGALLTDWTDTANHLPGGVDLPALSRSLFSEAAYNGIGFGLGFSVTVDPAKTLIPGSRGEYAWGGAATTSFWIDPAEELIAIFMTQVLPSSAYPLRRELRTLVYSAITESNL